MDLLHFEAEELYFDEPTTPEVARLLAEAQGCYGAGDAEAPLLQALAHAPNSLLVMVALYRFYFYQHRLTDALGIANLALDITAYRLGIARNWQALDQQQLGHAARQSMTLLRFHLLALKAMGYLLLRLGKHGEGKALLGKLVELDSHDRLGARQILAVLDAQEDPHA